MPRLPLLAVVVLAAPLYLLARASLLHREPGSGAPRVQEDYTPLQPHQDKAPPVQLDFYGEALCPGLPPSYFPVQLMASLGGQQRIFLCVHGCMGMAPRFTSNTNVKVHCSFHATGARQRRALCTHCLLSDTRARPQIALNSRQRYLRRCSSLALALFSRCATSAGGTRGARRKAPLCARPNAAFAVLVVPPAAMRCPAVDAMLGWPLACACVTVVRVRQRPRRHHS